MSHVVDARSKLIFNLSTLSFDFDFFYCCRWCRRHNSLQLWNEHASQGDLNCTDIPFLKNYCYQCFEHKKLVLQAAQCSPLSNRPDYFLLYRASYLKCKIMRWWYVLHPMRFLESNQSSYGFYRIFIYPIIFKRAMNLPTLKASQLICLMSKSIFCLKYNANCGFALFRSILLVWFGKIVAFDI